MVNRQTEIRAPQNGMNYGPRAYGSMAGQPSVSLKLSKSDQKTQSVGGVESLFDSWGWKRKLQNGFARLLIHGSEPLHEMHSESLMAINSSLSCRFVDLELENGELQEPDRHVQNMVDHYSLFIDLDKDVNWDAFEWFTENPGSLGAVDYLFKVDSGKHVDDINEISRNYNIYDSNIWLYPKGRKAKTVSERLAKITKSAKAHSWNVSPRHDILQEYEDE